jgi:hypothetical protein
MDVLMIFLMSGMAVILVMCAAYWLQHGGVFGFMFAAQLMDAIGELLAAILAGIFNQD